MTCPACENTKGFTYEGEQKLPDKSGAWVTYELWTCNGCGSTMCVQKTKP